LDYYIHPTAIVEAGAKIGSGTKVWLYSHLMPDCEVGERCQIGQGVYVGRGVKIGNVVKVQNHVSIYENVEIEYDVFCGPSMVFTNVINPRAFIERKHEFKRTLIKKGASIGANATLVCGIVCGRYSFIGAGAVVTKNVPDYALVTGVPARQRAWVCQCAVQLLEVKKDHYSCPECTKNYIFHQEDGLKENHGD